jgi:hypothetical protein
VNEEALAHYWGVVATKRKKQTSKNTYNLTSIFHAV